MSSIYTKCFLWFSNSKTTYSATIGRFIKMEEGHIFIKKFKIRVGLVYHLSSAKIIGLQIVLISISWSIVFGKTTNWDLVTPKATLINQLKLSLKKIRPEVVFENCITWTNWLFRLKQVNDNYLHK